MDTTQRKPATLIEAVRYFADLDICHAYMANLKWPEGVVRCPACDGENIGLIASRRMLQCKAKDCRKQFSVKVGTIFEDSPLPLDKWFVAVWSITNAKNGISSCELARAIGITQKSAWHMLHRVRHAMHVGSFDKFTGEVEVDETYIGGKARNMHKGKRKAVGRGSIGKAIVMGVLERNPVKGKSKARSMVVENIKRETLESQVVNHVEPGTAVYTDKLSSYDGLSAAFVHSFVDHAKAYVEGRCHTNGLENFWSLFKRCIKGTYVAVDAPHLGRYVDEQLFRFNERGMEDAGRFKIMMPGVVGKRLMYKTLIGATTPENCKKDGATSDGLAN